MKKLILLSLTAVTIILSSCKEDELITFDADKASLNFVKSLYLPSIIEPKYDTILFEEPFYADKETAQIKLPIRMSGKIVDYDRKYNVSLVAEECSKTLIEGTHFTLVKEQIFPKGEFADSVIVVVNLTKLRADKVLGLLVVKFVPNELFELGLEKFQSMGVKISGEGFSQQPEFWNRNGLNDYGGAYTSIKAAKYAELNGVDSDKWREFNKAKLYAYGKRTYQWFVDNPTYDNGKLVEFKGTINY